MNLDKIIAVRTSKTIFREGNDCIKVFSRRYPKDDILNEALNQACAEIAGFNVPKIKAVTVIDGKWAIVSEYIKGNTIERLIEENPECQEQYLTMLANLQMAVNSERCLRLSRLKDKMLLRICEFTRDNFSCDCSVREALEKKLAEMTEKNNFCHGDFTPANVVVGSDKKIYFLDWSHATSGPPEADAAMSYLAFLLKGKRQQADIYLNAYVKASGINKNDIIKLLPLVACVKYKKANLDEKLFLLNMVKNITDKNL